MNQQPKSIAKQPVLRPAQDFYQLRREGIGLIEKLASKIWTDFNIHDPGITILEELCYAFTDLAYRIDWEIKDLLTPEVAEQEGQQTYPDQAFFSAREILTINPTTQDDFRRLLIDLKQVRNAWVYPKECACDARYYAWCDKDRLILSYKKAEGNIADLNVVEPAGLYEILLELENDYALGDLNASKIESTIILDSGHSIVMELRFPELDPSASEQWLPFLKQGNILDSVALEMGATKGFDLYSTLSGDIDVDTGISERDLYIRSRWKELFYLNFTINMEGVSFSIKNATLRFFGGTSAKNSTTAILLKKILTDTNKTAFLQRYRIKMMEVRSAVDSAKAILLNHRNLDEDYCNIKIVAIEEVAVCADVEVQPDADIEWIQARIWFEIEQYFNPSIPFHTVKELMDADAAVEDIFNGPQLSSGFIKSEDLEAASLKTVLRTSDIVNKLMDIDGVIAVKQLILSKYDAQGNLVKGAADPEWSNGTSSLDPNKISASWVMLVNYRHQPRLYLNASRFLFFKNDLPFKPRMDEAYETLTQLRGKAEREKNYQADNDLEIPKGNFKNPEEYFPLQNAFPQTYGIGSSGLPPHASNLRQAQAKQLKAYLMVFEQMFANALSQLAHTSKLFSLDSEINRTYFVKEFSESLISGFDDLKKGLDKTAVERICENPPEFLDRRNRFLDHLMARFGEQFSEYALMLSDLEGRQVALDRLITDKISFLKAYPQISHDRARAFNYRLNSALQNNIPGIKKRISLLLGFPDLQFVRRGNSNGVGKYRLTDRNGKAWLEGDFTPDIEHIEDAYQKLIKRMVVPEAYKIIKYTLRGDPVRKYHLHLKDQELDLLGDHRFESKAAAQLMMDQLLAWSANERLIVVEHLLLRPKFPGDALYPVCTDGNCNICGDEDPYSFRLTFVMPGWSGVYADNLDMRRFAERTIRQEIPSHLIAKICWVGNDGSIENPCEKVIARLTDFLISEGFISGDIEAVEKKSCECAELIYRSFFSSFNDWYERKKLVCISADRLVELIHEQFSIAPKPSETSCGIKFEMSVWKKVEAMMADHFLNIALRGWQFERFENAWHLWLAINAQIDWTEERLHEGIQAILEANLNDNTQISSLCQLSSTILELTGNNFLLWMNSKIEANQEPVDFTEEDIVNLFDFDWSLLSGFKQVTRDVIQTFIKNRYKKYIAVSYRLHIVVKLLSELRNTYPNATLHDCDDGSDHNPVRLGNTALGNHHLRTTLS